jgi:beta-glucosidase
MQMKNLVRTALAYLAIVCTSNIAHAQPVYRDPNAPISTRVQDLLSRMTLEEKAAQLRSMWQGKQLIVDASGNFSTEKALEAIPNGIGQLARPHDTRGTPGFGADAYRTVEGTVAFVNAVQRFHVEKTRLGIPALFHEETSHGYLAADSTVFPIPPGLASTWDPDLVEEVFTVAAREARLRGATVALSPVLDLMREPRYGRSEEFFSEDPYLASQLGIAAVRGQQGRTRPLAKDHVFVTLKHFVHGTPQGGINLAPAEMSQRTLRENYLVPFAAVIKATNPALIMPSYNEVEGVPSHANVELLQKTGRERLGFRGAYFSDYDGISNLVSQHHIARNEDEAAILAMKTGVDADLPEGQVYARLPDLVRAGRIDQSQLDAAAGRILAMKFEAGLFEHPYADVRRAVRETNTPADIALARKAAQKSLILLKNDGILPLDPQARLKLAVIGPHADQPMFGGYSGRNRKAVSILAGIKAAVGPNVSVRHADGVWITEPDPGVSEAWRASVRPVPEHENDPRIAAAVELAKQSDIILLVLGDSPTITRESVGESFTGDRSTLGLFGDQDALVEAMIATGKPIVTLLLNGRPLAVTRLAEKANAVFEGWYLGQEAGNAFADVLFGRMNPGGKLTVSIPRSVGELPAFYNRHPSSDLNFYVEGKRAPLFAFGYGLSYTTFEISAPRLARQQIGSGESVAVDVDVTNTGKRVGDEVVQLYIRDDVSSVPRPILELKAFQRVALKPGERRTVRFELGPDALAFWDIDMHWVVEPGTFTISAGNSSVSLQSTTLTVASSQSSVNAAYTPQP